MEVIHVPGPPKEAFNKNRPISDLIRAQVNHLKHLEANLPADVRQQLPQHEITTEDDAARYIGAMTSYFSPSAGCGTGSRGPIAVPSVQPCDTHSPTNRPRHRSHQRIYTPTRRPTQNQSP